LKERVSYLGGHLAGTGFAAGFPPDAPKAPVYGSPYRRVNAFGGIFLRPGPRMAGLVTGSLNVAA
jgi:hypothetical protein